MLGFYTYIFEIFSKEMKKSQFTEEFSQRNYD